MNIVCVGGGPAGLYFAISAKLRNAGHDITVVERNPAGVTYGWGVTFSEGLLDSLYRNDPESGRQINEYRASWGNQEVRVGDRKPVPLGGYGYAIERQRLLDILTSRAIALGVDVQFEREVREPTEFRNADLVVACDGANSRVRNCYADKFDTHVETRRNKYIWLGTRRLFDSFMFAFEETAAGWIWFYTYPFNSDTTTFIVECSPETWHGLGFDQLGPAESRALLERIFARHLDGYPLVNQMPDLRAAPWVNFTRVTTSNWYHDNVALMGDAAHTTHFSIGSGTTLAMQDAIGLAERLDEDRDLPTALRNYQEQRREAVRTAQIAALNSTRWFEDVPRYVHQDPTQFAYALWQRRGGHPTWRYHLHLATQIELLRRVRAALSTVRRNARARRRTKLAGTGLLGATASMATGLPAEGKRSA
jgi:anthraniloyl-CoA monooxygenase